MHFFAKYFFALQTEKQRSEKDKKTLYVHNVYIPYISATVDHWQKNQIPFNAVTGKINKYYGRT
jgi:hypothetical protein